MIAAGDHAVAGAAPAAGDGPPEAGGAMPVVPAVVAPPAPPAGPISTATAGPDGLQRVQVLPGPLADTLQHLGLWTVPPTHDTPGVTLQDTAALLLAGAAAWSAAARQAPYGSEMSVPGLNRINEALFAPGRAFSSSGAAVGGLRAESLRRGFEVTLEDLDVSDPGRFGDSPLAALRAGSFESPRAYLACRLCFSSEPDNAGAVAQLEVAGGPTGALKRRGAGPLCEQRMNSSLRTYPMTPSGILEEQRAISCIVDGAEDTVVRQKILFLLRSGPFPRLNGTIRGGGEDAFAVVVRLEMLLSAARVGDRTSLAALFGLEAALGRFRATGPPNDTEAAAQARTGEVVERLRLVGAAASEPSAGGGGGVGGTSFSSVGGASSGCPSRQAIVAAGGEYHSLLDAILTLDDCMLAVKLALDSGSLVLRRALLHGSSMVSVHPAFGALHAHGLQANLFLAEQLLKNTILPAGSARVLAAAIDNKEAAKMLGGGLCRCRPSPNSASFTTTSSPLVTSSSEAWRGRTSRRSAQALRRSCPS